MNALLSSLIWAWTPNKSSITSLTRINVKLKWPWVDFDKFWALRSKLGYMFLEVILKLQLKPPLIIPNSYLTLPGSIWLREVLPEVPPQDLPDVQLEVYLNVLTSSNHNWVMPTHPRSWWVGENQIYCMAQVQILEFWVLWAGLCVTLTFLTLTWPGPGPDLDNNLLCMEKRKVSN